MEFSLHLEIVMVLQAKVGRRGGGGGIIVVVVAAVKWAREQSISAIVFHIEVR